MIKKEVDEQKVMRKDLRRTGWMMFLYYIVFFGAVLLFTTLQIAWEFVQNPNISQEALLDATISSGWSSLFGLALGVLVIYLFRRKQLFSYDMVYEAKPLPQKIFFRLLCGFMGLQLVFSFVSALLENIFNLFGYSITEQIEAATSSSTTVSMFLYVAIGAPIVEELVFRGALLRSLEKYGKTFAIVVSSILFGIYHGNITQGLFAFSIGLIFSYVTIEYSIKWAIAMHMINNLVFGEVLTVLLQSFPEEVQAGVSALIVTVFFFMAVYYFSRYFNDIRNYFKKQKTTPKAYRYIFTSLGIILFILLNLYLAIATITPL